MASELKMRSCGRAGCRWPAAASLSFRYDTRQVWLVDLAPQPHPSLYDLCPHHADTLTVPRGWDRVDEREHQEAVREPSGKDLVARLERQPEPAHAAASNRYAALSEDLPRLAQEYGVPAADADDSSTDGAGGDTATPAGAVDDAPRSKPEVHAAAEDGDPVASSSPRATSPSGATEATTTDVVPTRDLAPLPIGEPVTAPSPRDTERPSEPVRETGAHPGQLAIPVDALDEAEPGDAIVVSIETAGARRRDR